MRLLRWLVSNHDDIFVVVGCGLVAWVLGTIDWRLAVGLTGALLIAVGAGGLRRE